MEKEIEQDATVVVIGEEVGRYVGTYGVSQGLLERFGEKRVFDTSISEADKAIAEIPALTADTLTRIIAEEGATTEVGALITEVETREPS